MKKITIKFPDNMNESEAIKYIPDAFNNDASNYLAMTVGGDKNVLRFVNGRVAVMTKQTTGYTIEIKKDDEKKGTQRDG